MDGALMMSPAPGDVLHQYVSSELTGQLKKAIRSEGAHYRVAAAVNVRRGTSRLHVPDIVVAARDAVRRDTMVIPIGATVLLVEIVSKSNQSQDRVYKPALYAEAGVPAYWRVELEKPKRCVVVHELAGETYKEVASVTGRQAVDVAGRFTVELDVEALFDLG
ncbi:Uma2 family endonuclease [Allostreptomyces psammosilenae]|uniref:Uma2 family endonuclease n=1 Tax=Allostreptomyces psammosilenae TaxID=1892865 RepID=A0A852ZUS2_9ACTN|nr:Uma2 family endonuclease [Allostreptomyces psammosilenae]